MTALTGWLRTNRWWLPALVVAAALVALASSSNYWVWRSADVLDRPQTAVNGVLEFHAKSDANPLQTTLRVARVTTPSGTVEGLTAPVGVRLYAVHLAVVVPPHLPSVMDFCDAVLVDDQGRIYAQNAGLDDDRSVGHTGGCGSLDAPESGWTTELLFGVPDTARITELRISFDAPDYAVFPITAS